MTCSGSLQFCISNCNCYRQWLLPSPSPASPPAHLCLLQSWSEKYELKPVPDSLLVPLLPSHLMPAAAGRSVRSRQSVQPFANGLQQEREWMTAAKATARTRTRTRCFTARYQSSTPSNYCKASELLDKPGQAMPSTSLAQPVCQNTHNEPSRRVVALAPPQGKFCAGHSARSNSGGALEDGHGKGKSEGNAYFYLGIRDVVEHRK